MERYGYIIGELVTNSKCGIHLVKLTVAIIILGWIIWSLLVGSGKL